MKLKKSKFVANTKRSYTYTVHHLYRQSVFEQTTISVCTLLLGIFLLLPLQLDTVVYPYMAEVTALFCTLFALITYKRAGHLVNTYAGIMSLGLLAVSILCFSRPEYALEHFGTFLGTFIIIDGVHNLSIALRCSKVGMEGAFTYILSAVLVLLAGIMLLFEGPDRLLMSSGISLLIFSLVKICICAAIGKEIVRVVHYELKGGQ